MTRNDSRRWVFYINFKTGNQQFFGVHQELIHKEPKRTKLWKGLEDLLHQDPVESVGYMTYDEYQKVYSN